MLARFHTIKERSVCIGERRCCSHKYKSCVPLTTYTFLSLLAHTVYVGIAFCFYVFSHITFCMFSSSRQRNTLYSLSEPVECVWTFGRIVHGSHVKKAHTYSIGWHILCMYHIAPKWFSLAYSLKMLSSLKLSILKANIISPEQTVHLKGHLNTIYMHTATVTKLYTPYVCAPPFHFKGDYLHPYTSSVNLSFG